MKSLSGMILEASQRLPEGEVLHPELFLHLGSRTAVLRCLSQLVQHEQLLRVSRGLYVAPVATKFGLRSPTTTKVIHSLATVTNEVIVTHGAFAASALGLTTQVPVREIYLTNGRARTLQLGKTEVQIKRAPSWLLSLGKSAAGDAVRALDWLGEALVGNAVAKLHTQLPESQWLALVSAHRALPIWMANAICAYSDCASPHALPAHSQGLPNAAH